MAGRLFVWLGVAVGLALMALAGAGTAHARTARPDLRVLSLTAPSGHIALGARFSVRDVVMNRGRATAARSTVGFILSRDGRLGRGDVRLGARAVTPLPPGRRLVGIKSLKLPSTTKPGTYRLLACADYLRRVRGSSERTRCTVARGTLRVGTPVPQPGPGPQPDPGEPPAVVPLTLTDPADGATTNDATPRLAGAAAPGALVTIRLFRGGAAAGVPAATADAMPAPDGSWSTDSPSLDEGTFTGQAEQIDTFGRTSLSAPHTFFLDRTPPAVTVDAPADTADATPGLSGNAGDARGDGATVTVTIRSANTGAVAQTVGATRARARWSATVPSPLADGAYRVQAAQSDDAGNTGAGPEQTFSVDTTGPVPTITAPGANSTLTTAKPSLSGTAGDTPGDGSAVTVKFYSGTGTSGAPVRTLTATRSGASWTVANTTPLSAGTYTAVAEQQDSLGNAGTSPSRTFYVNPPGPNVTLTHPAGGPPTRDTTPTFDGAAGTAPEDLPTVTVKVYPGSSAGGTPVQTLTTSGANWSTAASPALPDGTYTAQAEQKDTAGNVARSSPATFTVDATDPTVALALSPTNPNGQNGWYTSMPTVHVVADDAHFTSLTCTVDGTSTAITTAAASTHSAEGDVPVTGDGSHTVSCGTTDAAGNGPVTKAATFKVDRTAPAVTVVNPVNTASTALMTFDGASGSGGGAVTVKVYSGSSTGGALVKSQPTSPASGSWSLTLNPVLTDGQTYTVQAEQSDDAGNVGRSTAHTFTVPVTLLAAGDIADCSSSGDEATAGLLTQRSGTIATLGDNVYADGLNPEGSLANFNHCYQPSWGIAKSRTMPATGNHEYKSDTTAGGYFDYFGSLAGTRGQGYYSYDRGSWHIIVLNTNDECQRVACNAGSAQEIWLRNDLAAHTNTCTLAYFHHPRFSSYVWGANGSDAAMLPIWNALYTAGADVVVNGHAHQYERFKPLKPDGTVDNTTGIREFISGTGGASHHSYAGPYSSRDDVFNDTTFGVLQLTLGSGGYSWQFAGAPGQPAFADSGSATCH